MWNVRWLDRIANVELLSKQVALLNHFMWEISEHFIEFVKNLNDFVFMLSGAIRSRRSDEGIVVLSENGRCFWFARHLRQRLGLAST